VVSTFFLINHSGDDDLGPEKRSTSHPPKALENMLKVNVEPWFQKCYRRFLKVHHLHFLDFFVVVWNYPLVNIYITNWKITIFNSYDSHNQRVKETKDLPLRWVAEDPSLRCGLHTEPGP
jgi:hypothetical protein